MPRRPLASNLWHPLPLGAVALLLLNDHWLKGSGLLPGWVTGKLSDVVGLFFFPLLVEAVLAGLLPNARRLADFAVALTGLAFLALKTSPRFNGWISSALGPNALDPTDLLALVSLVPSWFWMRRARAGGPRWGRLGALLLAAGASLATSQVRTVRSYPAWQVAGAARREAGCARLEVWVPKSGKEGMGATVRLEAAADACDIEWRSARFELGEAAFSASPPAQSHLTLGAPEYVYLPFAFDNERAWNRGERSGTLRLEWVVQGEPESWILPLVQTQDGWHHVDNPWRQPRDGGVEATPCDSGER